VKTKKLGGIHICLDHTFKNHLLRGECSTTNKKSVSINPANKEEIVGTVAMADQEIAKKTMHNS
jgi:delta 1-pyrroline-5-carboxylate dehydrogenase